MYAKKIKKEATGIKINMSLLALKYEKEPRTLGEIFCSAIKEALDVVFPTNGNEKYNRSNAREKDNYYKTLLDEIINQCNMLKEKL